MGLIQRKKSGNIMTGSRLIVEGQPMLSAKVFEVGFSGKKGSLPDEHRESPTTTKIEKDLPPCLNECAIFTQGTNQIGQPFVAYYNLTLNTIYPFLFENPWGNGMQDIANTTDKLWTLINTSPMVLKEYNLNLCPLSTTLFRTFNLTGLTQTPTIGLTAINNNNLLSQGTPNFSATPIVRYNISTNTIVPTILFYLPTDRQLSGDLLYVPSTTTGPKIITLTYLTGTGDPATAPRFISQFNVTTGLIEMDKVIPPNLIFSPWGLFTRDNKIYIQDGSNSKNWTIGLTWPYPLTYVNQINYPPYGNFGGGASNSPKCNIVSFKKQLPYISIPGTSAILPNDACLEWQNPENRDEIYLNPSGFTVVGTTKFYYNPDFTDPVPDGYWVSDGEQVYQVGEDGLTKDVKVC
jgi:hypothetical protein